jgi:hypothetical protein
MELKQALATPSSQQSDEAILEESVHLKIRQRVPELQDNMLRDIGRGHYYVTKYFFPIHS